MSMQRFQFQGTSEAALGLFLDPGGLPCFLGGGWCSFWGCGSWDFWAFGGISRLFGWELPIGCCSWWGCGSQCGWPLPLLLLLFLLIVTCVSPSPWNPSFQSIFDRLSNIVCQFALSHRWKVIIGGWLFYCGRLLGLPCWLIFYSFQLRTHHISIKALNKLMSVKAMSSSTSTSNWSVVQCYRSSEIVGTIAWISSGILQPNNLSNWVVHCILFLKSFKALSVPTFSQQRLQASV